MDQVPEVAVALAEAVEEAKRGVAGVKRAEAEAKRAQAARLMLAAVTFRLTGPRQLAVRLQLAKRQITVTEAGNKVTRVAAFATKVTILKRLTFTRKPIAGLDTTWAAMMRTTTSIILGNTDTFAAKSEPGISTGSRAETGIVSGLADFILAWRRTMMITSMIGTGEMTTS